MQEILSLVNIFLFLPLLKELSNGKPYSLCFIDQELPGLTDEATMELVRKINKDTMIVLISTSGLFPDSLRNYENMICMRRPLKITWLPDLLNEVSHTKLPE